ncbi:MAG: hypothetical protein ACNI3C_07520 [Candidatus Marinarcus sp.]|uniref:hypothetical protein n=1 Tax=Candidatus Marinarcus sp. TaxID=3100987 RepID=UPI003B00FA41
MKKLLSLTLATSFAFILSGCYGSASSMNTPKTLNLDVKHVCSIEENGIEKVLESAAKYNAIAKAEHLEFMRLGMTATQYIDSANAAVKSGAKTVDIVDKDGKTTGTVTTEYAAWRGCSFALRALQESEEAQTTWRLAIPGDGYKYE